MKLFGRNKTPKENDDQGAADASGSFKGDASSSNKEEESVVTKESDTDNTVKSDVSTSIIKSLFHRRRSSGASKAEEEANKKKEEEDEEKEEVDNDWVQPTTTTEDNNNGVVFEAPKPHATMWPSFGWGSSHDKKKDTEKEEEQQAETIELEVQEDDSVRIFDSESTISFHKLPGFAPDHPRPSVHEEAMDMLTGALMIYIFADLREMAREGVIHAPDLLENPTTVTQVMKAIAEHKDALTERAFDHEDVGQRLTALKAIHEQATQQKDDTMGDDSQNDNTLTNMIAQMLQGNSTGTSASSSEEPSEAMKKAQESSLETFHDEKSTNGVVYGIAVNHLRKRVTIIFRGSVTQQDFVTDAKSAQKFVDNPTIKMAQDGPDKIGLHSGFYEYLFRKDGEGKERLQHILSDAKRLLKKNPGYTLYCCGHSLGGALASLCGFFAALDHELLQNGPVVVISIASPQVGNKCFCEAFHTLERLRRLQYLRVSNTEDVVTHLPFLTLKATAFSPLLAAVFGPGNLYKHCGVHLELKSVEEEEKEKTQHFKLDKNFKMSHSHGASAIVDTVSEEFKRSIAAARLLVESIKPLTGGDFDAMTKFHSCVEYEARLMAAEAYLSGVTLDELYQDEAIVGAALAREICE